MQYLAHLYNYVYKPVSKYYAAPKYGRQQAVSAINVISCRATVIARRAWNSYHNSVKIKSYSKCGTKSVSSKGKKYSMHDR